jgi:DNA-binding NtrC family response regulator
MGNETILKGKKLLIVDDEPDVLDALEEELTMCALDSAPSFEAAKEFLDQHDYDAVILDIMGVQGYDLLRIATEKDIPALMLTAHALSPDNLVKSIEKGAQSYVPKDKISDIATYLADILRAREQGIERDMTWFSRLREFFDMKFGPGWKEEHKAFWEQFDSAYQAAKKELR